MVSEKHTHTKIVTIRDSESYEPQVANYVIFRCENLYQKYVNRVSMILERKGSGTELMQI